MLFDDRHHAGVMLGKELDVYRGQAETLVLALPRGGVVVGFEVAVALHLALDVFITRKIGLPESPEYAIGAVSETGSLYLNPGAAGYWNESSEDVDGLIDAQRHEIGRRQILYRNGRTLPQIQDHTVIVIDDGIATGSTFFATIEAIKKLFPCRLAAAIPVSPLSTADKVRALVDHCVILATPEPFGAVGEFYADFHQIEDDEVIRCLEQAEQAYQERPQSVRGGLAPVRSNHQSEM